MSENEEPDWAAELAKQNERIARQFEPVIRAHEAMRRQMEPYIRAHEAIQRQMEPIIQGLAAMQRQMEPYIRASEALRRQMEPMTRAAEQLGRLSRLSVGPTLPFPQRIAFAVDASLRSVMPPGPVAHERSAALTVDIALNASAEVIPRSDGDVATAADTESVTAAPDRAKGLAALSDGEIAFLVLVWLYALVLPWWATRLPPEYHQMLNDSYATVALALTITLRVLDKKR